MNYIPIFAAALILLSAVFGYVMESDHNPKKGAVYGGLIMAVILGIGYGISTSSQEAVRKPHPAELMTPEELAAEKAEGNGDGQWHRNVRRCEKRNRKSTKLLVEKSALLRVISSFPSSENIKWATTHTLLRWKVA